MKKGDKLRVIRMPRARAAVPCASSGCPEMTTGTWCLSCTRRRWYEAKQGKLSRVYTRRVMQDDASPEEIEAMFQSALQEIKRRPRGEPELRWASSIKPCGEV